MEVGHSLDDEEWMASAGGALSSGGLRSRSAERAGGLVQLVGNVPPAIVFGGGSRSAEPSARQSPTLVGIAAFARSSTDSSGAADPPQLARSATPRVARRGRGRAAAVSYPVPPVSPVPPEGRPERDFDRGATAPAPRRPESFARAQTLPADAVSQGTNSSEGVEVTRLRRRLRNMSTDLERQHRTYAGTGQTYQRFATACFILTLVLSGGVAFVELFTEEEDARKSATTVCGGLIFGIQSLNKYFRWEAYAKTYETAARKLFRIHDEIAGEMNVGGGLANAPELLTRAREISREIRENTDYIPWSTLRSSAPPV